MAALVSTDGVVIKEEEISNDGSKDENEINNDYHCESEGNDEPYVKLELSNNDEENQKEEEDDAVVASSITFGASDGFYNIQEEEEEEEQPQRNVIAVDDEEEDFIPAPIIPLEPQQKAVAGPAPAQEQRKRRLLSGSTFLGGAAMVRRQKRLASERKRRATIIENPLQREKNNTILPKTMPPAERLLAAILRSLPQTMIDAQAGAEGKRNNQKQQQQQQFDNAAHEKWIKAIFTQRLGLQIPNATSMSLPSQFSSNRQLFSSYATLVVEEARYLIAKELYQRQQQKSGSDSILMKCTAVELPKQKKGSFHAIYTFAFIHPIPREQRSSLKTGTVVQLIPMNKNDNQNNKNASNVSRKKPANDDANIILGSIATRVTTERQILKQQNYSSGDVDMEQICVMVYNNSNKNLQPESNVSMTILCTVLNMQRQYEACCLGMGTNMDQPSIMLTTFTSELLGLRREHQRFTNDSNKKDSTKENDDRTELGRQAGITIPKLNKTQLNAANSFLNSPDNRISIIQGPPGTGKTTTVVSIICRYLLQAMIKNFSKRLLVCGPTNKSVTVIADRLLKCLARDKQVNVVIIGDQDRLLADGQLDVERMIVYAFVPMLIRDLKDALMDLERGWIDVAAFETAVVKFDTKIQRQLISFYNDEFSAQSVGLIDYAQELAKDLKSLRRILPNISKAVKKLCHMMESWDEQLVVLELLNCAHVVFCTLASAGSTPVKKMLRVDDLIVDEASAATEPEVYIPLSKMPKRMLLVGDPKQLPATVLSPLASQRGLSRSLQERLMIECNFEYTMLDVQYRMRKEISQWPVAQFYDGKISNGPNVLEEGYGVDACIFQGMPYCFLQVKGTEQHNHFGSIYNEEECKVIESLVLDLKDRARGQDWSSKRKLRILSFYQAQVSLLRTMLDRRGLRRVMVSTVDSSQGCEADTVIISFVRGNHGTVGFLADSRRLNVAVTRAKYQLICVGNAQAMTAIKKETGADVGCIQELAVDATNRDCVISVDLSERDANNNNNKRRHNRNPRHHHRNGGEKRKRDDRRERERKHGRFGNRRYNNNKNNRR